MEKFECRTCPYWSVDETQKAMRPPDNGIVAAAQVALDVRIGLCRGNPPSVVMVPMQNAAGAVVGMGANYPDPYVREDRPGCHLHPDAKPGSLQRI